MLEIRLDKPATRGFIRAGWNQGDEADIVVKAEALPATGPPTTTMLATGTPLLLTGITLAIIARRRNYSR